MEEISKGMNDMVNIEAWKTIILYILVFIFIILNTKKENYSRKLIFNRNSFLQLWQHCDLYTQF